MASCGSQSTSDFDYLVGFASQTSSVHCSTEEHKKVNRIISAIKDCNILSFFKELALCNCKDYIRNEVVPLFCSRIKSKGVSCVTSAVTDLHQKVSWYEDRLSLWSDSNIISEFHDAFLSSVLWEIDDAVKEVFTEYMSHSMQSYLWLQASSSNEGSDFLMEEDQYVTLEWNGRCTKLSPEECRGFNTKHGIHVANFLIRELDLLHTLVEQPLLKVLGTEIKRYITCTCAGDFEKKWLKEHLESWVEGKVMRYIQEIFWCSSNLDSNNVSDAMQSLQTYNKWKRKLLYILHETYTEMRIGEMFAIITDFPDSAPAIEDLRDCLEKTNQRRHLIDTLRKDFSGRVLHRGVSTGDMITMYISAVKALRMLDPSGVVMEIVLEGYMQHLVNRDDTVRSIMGSLLDNDAESDLSAELANAPTSAPLYSRDLSDSLFLEEVTDNYEDWKPDPREADPTRSDKSHRKSDIISLLINMYGTAEKFITEYQKLLSKRLLSIWCAGMTEDAEIKNLELLKLRFGEADMEKCGVMLKDISDSRRINAHVAGVLQKNSDEISQPPYDVNTLIISSEYWPEYEKHEFSLPGDMEEALKSFTEVYENHKASRSLHWIHSQSRVDIEIELQSQAISFKVTPLVASIIRLFESKDTWTLSEMCSELRISESILKKNIIFWVHRHLLKETPSNTYVLMEDVSATHRAPAEFEDLSSDNEDEDLDADNTKQKQQEAVLWNFINGMLINLKSLPLERIQRMLKMFATHDPSMKMDETRLKALLNEKVQQGILYVDGGQYCLNKDKEKS